jgi:glutamyl-tRNA reductase
MNGDIVISVVGLSYKSASVKDLEEFQLPRKHSDKFLQLFASQVGIEGVVFLSTCNRNEIYFTHHKSIKPKDFVLNFYQEFLEKNPKGKGKLFYHYSGRKAIAHLFRVISGLDSLVLGEYQIQGQVKEAYSIACQAKTVNKILHKLFHSAFRCGKTIRNSTSIGKGKLSVSGVATEIVLQNLMPETTLLVVGVNENTTILANELKKENFSNFIFANRTLHKAQALADEYGGFTIPLAEIANILPKVSIVFSSTSAPNYIITADVIRNSFERAGNPRLIVDLAIPRDIESDGIPSEIVYYDIEQIRDYLEKQNKSKLEDLPLCEKIIEQEVALFLSWQESSEDDILGPYAEKFEKIRLELLDEYRNIFAPNEFGKIDKLTRQLIHRSKSIFISVLKEQNEGKKG